MKTRIQIARNKALIEAAARGHTADLTKLVRDGAQLDGVEQGATPLIAATVNNQLQAVKALLALGARVEVADEQGKTAMTHAINQRFPSVVELLVQAGADLNAKDMWGNTALTRAAGSQQQEIVDDLIALQVDVNVTTTLGVSALTRAQNHEGIMRSLLDAKADLSHEANKDALSRAVIPGKVEIAQMLLQAGAKPDATDGSSQILLTHAVDQKNVDLVRSLIAAKADPNHSANKHALTYALGSRNPELLQALMEAGARPDLNTLPGQKAVIVAFALGKADAVAQWFPASADAPDDTVWNPLPDAVASASAEIIGILRDAGYSIHSRSESGHTLLMLASQLGRASILDSLLQPRNGASGSDPNAQADISGKTALMYAVEKKCTDTMKLLLAAGADPSAVDHAGRSVLEYADKCPSAAHKNAMQSLLVETIATRALEFAGPLRLAQAGFDELLDMQHGDALDHASSLDDLDLQAATHWHELMNTIDESPTSVE